MRRLALLLTLAACAPVGPIAQVNARAPYPSLVSTAGLLAGASAGDSGRGVALEAYVASRMAALRARADALRAMRPTGLPTSDLHAQMAALRERAEQMRAP